MVPGEVSSHKEQVHTNNSPFPPPRNKHGAWTLYDFMDPKEFLRHANSSTHIPLTGSNIRKTGVRHMCLKLLNSLFNQYPLLL